VFSSRKGSESEASTVVVYCNQAGTVVRVRHGKRTTTVGAQQRKFTAGAYTRRGRRHGEGAEKGRARAERRGWWRHGHGRAERGRTERRPLGGSSGTRVLKGEPARRCNRMAHRWRRKWVCGSPVRPPRMRSMLVHIVW
jgi:hypothetical protein